MKNILSLAAAPARLRLVFIDTQHLDEEGPQFIEEPALALALVQRGNTQEVLPMTLADGFGVIAEDFFGYVGAYWQDDVAGKEELLGNAGVMVWKTVKKTAHKKG